MESDGTEDGYTVDITVEDFSGEEEEGSVEDYVEDCAVEIGVVH